MRLVVTGDREWTDRETIKATFIAIQSVYQYPVTLIQGDCRGADLLSKSVAIELGWAVESYPADWNRYGPRAGPIRNQQMIDEGKPDMGVAFHPNLKKSKGTKDMVSRLKRHKIPYHHIKGKQNG